MRRRAVVCEMDGGCTRSRAGVCKSGRSLAAAVTGGDCCGQCQRWECQRRDEGEWCVWVAGALARAVNLVRLGGSRGSVGWE